MRDLFELAKFLNHNAIPKIKRRPKTFLGIAKQPHYENVMSNIYAFYFDLNEVHGMGDLFITSLLKIIKSTELGTTKNVYDITDFAVDTEFTTDKNGRIDVLISSADHAIIIENKVYHHLNNNLADYWDSTRVSDNNTSNKIGVVLSLNKVYPKHVHFINVTHLELLREVLQNLGPHMMDAKDKYVVFLKDFYQNSINLSKSEMDSKEIKFYFDHQAKIIEAKDFHFAVRTHISNQIEQVTGLIDEDLTVPTSKGELGKRLRYMQSIKNKNLMFTVLFEKLLEPQRELILIVELKHDLLKSKDLYKSIHADRTFENITCSDFYINTNSSWCHFAIARYTLNNDDVSNLSNFIVNKLHDDELLSIFRKLNEVVPKTS
ncbi:MAG TPA: PD-(D/E)XK nuclease family protein [Flavobacterium sp.]|jgi:hypothetical protein